MKPKNVLITGAAGFIGSHLTEKCLELGYSVKVLIRYNSKNYWGWLEECEKRNEIEVISADIRDYTSVANAVRGCDTVFHLAALIGIPYSYVSSIAYIETNVIGTHNALHAAMEHNVENVLITSTAETYGTAQYIPVDENHPTICQSPYAASKISADQFAISYHKSFNLPVKIIRLFNTYGPRQSARAIIPTIITQALNGQTELKLGDLSPTRTFTYVKDVVNGFLEIAASDCFIGEIIHVATDNEISGYDILEIVQNKLNKNFNAITDVERIRPTNSEVHRLKCNNRKILENTNWKPQYSFEEGISETIEWLKEHMSYYKPEIYNV
jgi:NAD dependent epimerase/dehydratase